MSKQFVKIRTRVKLLNQSSYLELLLLTLAVLIGALVRYSVIIGSDFPYSAGGLYYVFIEEIKKNHYLLPEFVKWNMTNLPFAYPPLPFYFLAAISDLTGLSTIETLRLVPAFISTLTIVAFYLLSRELLYSWRQRVFATFAFALLIPAFYEFIEGGGIARGMGFGFMILLLREIYLLYTKPKDGQTKRHIIMSIIFASGLILCHPLYTVYGVFSIFIFFLFYGRNLQSIINSLFIGAGVLLVTAPWWVTIVIRHGLSNIIAASSTGSSPPLTLILARFSFSFTFELLTPVLGFIGLIGLFFLVANNKYLIPAWGLLTIIFIGRGGDSCVSIALALMVGYGLDKILLFVLSDLIKDKTQETILEKDQQHKKQRGQKIAIDIILAYVAFWAFLSAINFTLKTESTTLPKEERQAMTWTSNNTPANSKFVILEPKYTPASEWFPALAQRESATTYEGYEWLPNQYAPRINNFGDLQSCRDKDSMCLETWSKNTGHSFNYVYISRRPVASLPGNGICCTVLENSVAASTNYERVFDLPGVVIFKRKTEL